MLRTLSVRDFVIVESLELDFGKGFSALTGETGAGKSILIDALQLAMGARGDATAVREGAKRADITAAFDAGDAAKAWLKENDIDEDGEVLLRRTVDAEGRSKAFINGVAATATQLRDLAALLVDIHGQHAHQLLLKSGEQRTLLDRHAGITEDVAMLAQAYDAWQDAKEKLDKLLTDEKAMAERREDLLYQVGELGRLAPKEGEWEQVSSDFDRLSNAATFIETTSGAINELSEADNAVISRLNSVANGLNKLGGMDANLMPVAELVESANIQLKEAVYALNDYLARTDLDPGMLEAVEKRMEALYQTAKRMRTDPGSLAKLLENRKKELDELDKGMDTAALEKALAALEKDYLGKAKAVSQKRTAAAKDLSDRVTAIMAELHMEGGRFEVSVTDAAPSKHGMDAVEFLVAGHAGTAPKALSKVASGGELSRISLAVSVIASRATETPTLIFDEVDSGVGGAVAEVVGRLLKTLSSDHQVLCVTHLPQVASQAASHFLVEKKTAEDTGKTVSGVTELEGDARVGEIARMLGGIEMTDATLAHAREMLGKKK